METWNRLIAIGVKERREERWKEGEGTSQRRCMNDAWSQTMKRGLTVG